MAPDNSQEAKDSCGYAVDLIKQFLTLASAGIAFVVGLVFSDSPGKLSYDAVLWSLLLFGASLLLGFFSYMGIIGNINKEKSYAIYVPCIQFPAALQILVFIAGVVILTIPTIKLSGKPPDSAKPPQEVKILNWPARAASTAPAPPAAKP